MHPPYHHQQQPFHGQGTGYSYPPVSPPKKEADRSFASKIAGLVARGAAEEAGKSAVDGLLHGSHDDSDEESTEMANKVIETGISGILGIFSDD